MVGVYRSHFKLLSPNVKIFLLGNAIQGIGMSIYTLLFNLYLKELGYGESAIGGLISTTSLGIAMTAIPAAFIIEKFHTKHLVVAGMAAASGFFFLQVLNTSETALFTFGLLASMFQALFNISISPFYLRNSTKEVRTSLFAMNSSINMFAHFVGYLLGGYLPAVMKWIFPEIARVDHFRYTMILSISIVILSNLAFMQIKKVPIPRIKRRLFEGVREKEWRVIGKLMIPKACFAFGGGLIVPFMNLYLKEKFGFSSKSIGVSYAILQFFIFLGIFLSPILVKRTTHLKFIMTTSFFSIPFMVAMGLTGNVFLVLTCFVMRGMLMNMSSPITSMFEMERVRERECVFASAIILFGYHMVYTFSTRLGGFLIEKYSFGPTFYIAAGFYVLAVYLYHRFFKSDVRHDTMKIELLPPPEEKTIEAA